MSNPKAKDALQENMDDLCTPQPLPDPVKPIPLTNTDRAIVDMLIADNILPRTVLTQGFTTVNFVGYEKTETYALDQPKVFIKRIITERWQQLIYSKNYTKYVAYQSAE